MPLPINHAVTAAITLPPSVWDDPVRFTQMFANLGLFLGGLAGTITLVLIGLRTFNNQVDAGFREIFAYFWQNEKVSLGRDIITYDDQFDLIGPILQHMAETDDKRTPVYDEEKRIRIEAINNFCACIARVDFLGASRMSKRPKRMFDNVFSYWLTAISERPALDAYYKRYWTYPIGQKKGTAQKPQ